MQEIIVQIEKIVPEGKGFALYENTPVYIVGALPGEKIKAEIIRKKNNFYEAKIVEILEKSPKRIEPLESHYMSCSPWQIIGKNYQDELKSEIIRKCFKNLADTEIENLDFISPENRFHYRNKIEFSFGENEDGIFLAFHERGSHKKMLELHEGCMLADGQINQKALEILELLCKTKIEEFDLKSLIIRKSFYENKTIAILLVKNERERVLELLDLAKSSNRIDNFAIALSSYKSPIATIDKILFQNGDLNLIEKVRNIKLKYSIDSFFQNNIEMFEHAIEDIRNFLDDKDIVLELYSGVGSIGLNIADKVKSILGIEIIGNAVICSNENAKLNKINNFDAIFSASEKITSSHFDNISTLIIDPPRTGLHKKVIKKIIENLPPKIIYLSCNPITQASDFNNLKEYYNLKFIKGYDFYPNTPHMECLIILEKK